MFPRAGRTGLTAVVAGVLFLVAIPLYPIFTAIQGFATAPALIFVGLLMMTSVLKVKFDGDIADAIGAFLAIFMMPLHLFDRHGIMFGMLAGLSSSCSPARQRISPRIMYGVGILFVIRIITLVRHVAS